MTPSAHLHSRRVRSTTRAPLEKDFATSGNGSIVVPHGLGAPSDMQSAVRDGFMQAQMAQR